jgi:hypothetical protein
MSLLHVSSEKLWCCQGDVTKERQVEHEMGIVNENKVKLSL